VDIEAQLSQAKRDGLYRQLTTVESAQDRHIQVGGRELVNFGSNNYLGLANRWELKIAVIEAIKKWGNSAGASRLVVGNMGIIEELEGALARLKATEAALVYPTGYAANMGVITALLGQGDMVCIDKLNHASIIDACRFSGAEMRVYPHLGLGKLEALLARAGRYARRFIITDTVFSMDGDLAPLPEIVALKQKYNATLIVDDAHGTGVFGPHGEGVAAHYGVEGKIDIVVGTLSKALGSIGGFVASSATVREFLINASRPFIYTTGIAPSACAAALAALRLLEAEPGLRERLRANVSWLRTKMHELGMECASGESPILPVPAGSNERALALAQTLLDHGVMAPAIRPPTVPSEKARVRISVMSTHTKEDLGTLVEALAAWSKQ